MTNAADFLDEKAKQDPKVRERLRKAERVAGKASWVPKLICGDNGPRAIEANVVLALREDPAFAGKLRLNELSQAVECTAMPWRACDGWRPWTDVDDINLAVWMQHCGPAVKPATCAAAVQLVAADHPCHPVRQYLDGLAWDGAGRLDHWLGTYLGAEPKPPAENAAKEERAAYAARCRYVREVGRRWLISAVARVYKPGCKADHALILEGRQRAGKSSALAALVPDPAWFADEVSDLGTKDSAQDLRGKWLLELAELSAMKRGEIERTKAFMSRSVDHYRPSYGRRSQDFLRECVFAGTTNGDAYLGDETGNRRFWPVKVGTIDLEGLRRDRDQLWAEAAAAFKAGETWWLEEEVERAAADEQEERRIVDPWEADLLDWASRQSYPIAIGDALAAMDVPRERRDQAAANRVARIFKVAGWDRFQRREAGARVWLYRRPSPVSPDDNRPTGDGKASNGAAVTSVTSVTSRSETLGGSSAYGSAHRVGESGGDTGDTGDRPGNARDSVTSMGRATGDTARTGDTAPAREPRPDWRDSQAWSARLREAGTSRDRRNTVVLDWGQAAGCRIDTSNGRLDLLVPKGLADCPAKFALLKQARNARIDVRPLEPGARH